MKVKINNIGVIKNCNVEFIPGINLIIGSSGSGKSTLLRSIYNIATNGFSDSDISFGSNSMSIDVECNGNNIKYYRNNSNRSEKCAYTVNGEQYVKLGRTPLQAVTDTLKISDIDINSDRINFNFNLQFAAPFLILGSQSTLYNVLTYRSTCDVSSINEYYSTDVKNNAYELVTQVHLKEQLESNLKDLECQKDKISCVEDLYSRFIECTHTKDDISYIKSIIEKLTDLEKCNNALSSIESSIDLIDKAISDTYALIDVNAQFKNVCEYNKSIKYINNIKSTIDSVNNSMYNADIIINLLHVLKIIKLYNDICSKLNIIEKCLKLCENYAHDDNFISDMSSQYRLLKEKLKCDNIINVLSNIKIDDIKCIDDLLCVELKYKSINNANNNIESINNKLDTICTEMSEFNVCPLCGNSIHNCKGC